MPLTTPHPYPAYKPSGVPWLGDVPQHWRVSPVKHCYEVQLGKMLQNTPKSVDDEEVPYLKAVNVQWFSVQNADSPTMWANPREIKQFGITKGDLLVCEGGEGGRCGLISSDIEGYIIQNALHRVRPIGLGTNPYLQYAMYAAAEYGWFDALNNKATIAHFTSEKLGAFLIPLPPLPEQRAIVRYLDHVDERIQRYVDAKEKLVGVMEEEKQAVVNRAVTRGLDPNVRLKPSGVDWLGDVPEHWEVRRLGQIATSFRTGPFGSMLHQSDYIENGIPVVNPVHMRGGEIVEDSKSSVPEAIAEKLSNYRLERHDLVFSRRGELGRCVLVRDREANWLCGTGSIRVRVSYCGIRPEFLIQALHGQWVGEHLSIFSVGTTMANLNTGILKGVPVPLPPVDEQGDILEDIRKKGQGIDAAITRAQLQTELLQEYRTRLISDVVTGKVDVREAASQLPEEPVYDVPIDTKGLMTDNEKAGLNSAPA